MQFQLFNLSRKGWLANLTSVYWTWRPVSGVIFDAVHLYSRGIFFLRFFSSKEVTALWPKEFGRSPDWKWIPSLCCFNGWSSTLFFVLSYSSTANFRWHLNLQWFFCICVSSFSLCYFLFLKHPFLYAICTCFSADDSILPLLEVIGFPKDEPDADGNPCLSCWHVWDNHETPQCVE